MTARVLRVPRSYLSLGTRNKRRGVSVIKDPYGSNVSLLLPCDGFADISRTPKTISTYGNIANSVSYSPFNGRRSCYFDGTNSYLSIAHHADLSFGTISSSTNFSVEFLVYPTGTMGSNVLYWLLSKGMPGSGGNGYPGWGIAIYNGQIRLMVGGLTPNAGWIITTNKLTANVWTYIAIVCAAGAPYFYFNGIPQTYSYAYGTTMINSVTDNSNYALEIGCSQIDSTNLTRTNWFVGYLYGVRITKNIARDIAYKVPTSPFPNPAL